MDPEKTFGQRLLKRNDVAAYSDKLKSFVADLILNSRSTDLFAKVKAALGVPSFKMETNEALYLTQELPNMIDHLKTNQMLPAIFFSFNRHYCEVSCVDTAETLKDRAVS